MVAHSYPSVAHGHPMVAHGLPSVAHGHPMVAHGHPMVAHGLPSVAHGLPMVAHSLPSVAHGLPMVAHGYPSVAHGLPMVAHGYPSVAHGYPSVAHGLPMVAHAISCPFSSVLVSRSCAATCSATPSEVLRDFKTDKGSICETAINSSMSDCSASGKHLRASALDPAMTNAPIKCRRGVVASDAERIAPPDARSEISVIGSSLPAVLGSMAPQHLRRTIEFTLPAGDSASPMPCSAFAERAPAMPRHGHGVHRCH
ncbi:hypothetical protein M405DRAFT_938561 [Rhizopogon salebrosus TDB-379]|nr:hypothetical protein M405DRAFT_938561 [Rhizopogon salebrosus TDB-379]